MKVQIKRLRKLSSVGCETIKTAIKEMANVNRTFKNTAKRIETSEGLRRVRGYDPKLP
jgi:hypothetical protein